MLQSDILDELNQRLAIAHTRYAAGSLPEQRALRGCELALSALQQGSYGVGALLYDSQGRVLVEAGNRVFAEGFQSAAHAEMLVLDRFESAFADYGSRQSLTLLSTLEPCPMCLSRILASGIGQLEFLAADPDGGQALHLNRLPAAWQNLSRLCDIRQLNQPQEFCDLARDVAAAHKDRLRRKLIASVRPDLL